MSKIYFLLILLFISSQYSFTQKQNANKALSNIEAGFKTPPDSIKPRVYWYWLSDNISEEGVKRDLEAMKNVGIGGAYIGNIGLDSNETTYGKVKFMSNEWWKITQAAVSTATKLGIDIGFFNSPGWSQSGGPWIKPNESMRYLAPVEFHVKGGGKIEQKLDVPYKDFQDIVVLAFPESAYENDNILTTNPKVTSNPQIENLANMFNGKTQDDVFLVKKDSCLIDVETEKPYTARSITFYPVQKPFSLEYELQVEQGNNYVTIKKDIIDRSNPRTQVGFIPYGPVCISLHDVKTSQFRFIFKNINGEAGFSEIQILGAPRVERYIEKQLAKMFQSPQPLWDTYKWPEQEEPENKDMCVSLSGEKDITKFLNSGGILNWDAPEGNWVILRIGMVPTGVTNSPAVPEARGLEVDKMSKADIEKHFDAFVGKILNKIPEAERKSFKYVVADSYETGSENWTDGLTEIFKQQYGYNPLPWMPVLTGRIVSSADESNRFLWDLRRLVADLIAYNYVGGLREVSNKHGLKLWLENYGHWGYPSEFLTYGGQADEVSGEFWAEGDLGKIELKDASSAAHIYGKNNVWAESFTAGGNEFGRYPALLKKRGDWSFTEGINSTLLHVYISQPYEEQQPGVNAWFGTEFNRLNTWFSSSKGFIDYVRRCNFMLQQGKPVADVAYFIGEDAPLMTGNCDPALPRGYSYDYINAEVIENRLSVKDGKLMLPDGMSYRILVLPKLETIRPELLKKISGLVKDGAVVLGPSPVKSPSLQNYPQADNEVKSLAKELWGNVDGDKVKFKKFGEGMVIMGMDMQSALNMLKVIPDININKSDSVLCIHRKLTDSDIYFLTNQSDKTLDINPVFRVTGKAPELWDAVTGEIRKLPVYVQQEGSISVQLKMLPSQSWFVVFSPKSTKEIFNKPSNFPEEKPVMSITGPWQVTFDPAMRGPANPVVFDSLVDWAKRPEKEIRYYSGKAVYKTSFTIDKLNIRENIYLNLSKVGCVAEVKLNGKNVGNIWTIPWSADITNAIKAGKNELEIEVANTWVNRLIGDKNLPEKDRKTWTISNPYKADSPLQPSGLLGPVTLNSVQY